ncbi:hypothetical protein BsWGS_25370 [Bradybaena similaris]
MDYSWCSILLLVLVMGVSSLVSSQPCPYEEEKCVCSGSKLVCTNLDSVPALKSVYTNIDTLIFLNGSIRSIPTDSLPANLVSITFENADISDIADDAFNSSTATLREVNFIKLKLPRLPTALLAVDNLTSLTAAENPMSGSYNRTLMQHLGKSVRVLKLMPMITYQWNEWFPYFTCLEEFNMYGTFIGYGNISFTSLAGRLRYLNLTSTYGELPNSYIFAGLSLTHLVLSNNNFRSNGTLLDILLLPIVTTLQNLYLDSNGLYEIPSSISKMGNLLFLDLSLNDITTIPSNIFPQSLRDLDLHNNKILQITDTTFSNGSQLQTLNLNLNFHVNVSPLAFLPLQQLRVLLIQYGGITMLPISLTALTKLEYLDLYFNLEMKCYCPRGELAKWYRSLTNITVIGECEPYNSDYGHDLLLYFEMGEYKIICSGFTTLASSWHLSLMMIFVSVVMFVF